MGERSLKADETPAANAPRLGRAVRRYGRGALWALPGLLMLLAVLPTVLCWTPLSNYLVSWGMAGSSYRAEMRQVSFGWLTPLRVDQLRLSRREGAGRVEVARLATSRALLGLLVHRPDLGDVQVERPQVEVVLTDPPPASNGRSTARSPGNTRSVRVPTFAARIDDARFALRETADAEPVVELSDVDVRLRVERSAGTPRLSIQPFSLFDHERLTPEMCNRGLQLVAPILANAVQVQGEVSCEFTKCEIPLAGDPRRSLSAARVQGTLQLHAVETAAKNPLLQRLGQVLSRLLDLPYPERVRIAEDCRVAFELREGRVYHEGLHFGLPQVSEDLVFRTSGYVGFDESLQLTLEIPLPATLLADGPLAQRIASRPLALQVGGTLSEPQVGLPEGSTWWKEVTGRLLEITPGAEGDIPVAAEAAEAALQAAGQLLQQRRDRVESGEAAPLFDRLRQRIRARREGTNGARDPGSAERSRPGGRLRLLRPPIGEDADPPDSKPAARGREF